MVGTTIAREADGGIYLHAGPEIGVASTKAFTSQVAVLALLTLRARPAAQPEHPCRAGSSSRRSTALPGQIEQILAKADEVKRRSPSSSTPRNNFLYLGRGVNFPVALEGALKLKEISYIHAEGYPAAEMKHGPIALIDENMPVVFIAPRDAVHSKIVSQHRGGEGARRQGASPSPPRATPRSSALADATFTIPADARPAARRS